MTEEATAAVEPAVQEIAQEQAPATNPRDAFISMIPEEIRNEGVFANFKDVGDLARSYVSAAKMVGMDKNSLLPIPRDDSEEAWNAVYEKLGRPESPDKYNIEQYRSFVGDEDSFKRNIEAMHKAGMNQKQVDAVLGTFFSDVKQTLEQSEAAQKETFLQWEDQIKQEYGKAKDEKLNAAVNLLEKAGGDELVKLVEENPHVFKNPAFVKFAVAMAEKTGEGQTILANGSTISGAISPADAMQQINALRLDPNFQKAYTDNSHPQHDYYVKQMERLFSFAYPG